MRIYLPSVGVPERISSINDFKRLAEVSSTDRHELVDDPSSADILLFTECHQLDDPISLRRITESEVFRSFPGRSYVFDQRPRAYCSMPGLFTSVPWKYLRTEYQIPWSYHMISDIARDDREPDMLFSFVGTARSHPCREPLLELNHPRGLVQRVDGHVNWQPDDTGFADRKESFNQSLFRSSFVLCPRGRATSSFRFYEAMAAGRVPVVLADAWIPPTGIDLTEFAIRWPENNLRGLVAYLEKNEHKAAEMGRRAREVYEQRFAPDVMFDNIGDALELLHATRPWDTFPRNGFAPDRRVIRHAAGLTKRKIERLRK